MDINKEKATPKPMGFRDAVVPKPMVFEDAVRENVRLRIALRGTSGSGKTYGALCLATGLGGKIGVIDTEQRSSSFYADKFEFKNLDLEAPYTPERYIEAIKLAEKSGIDVLIIDSITHEWEGIGGFLEERQKVADARFKGNVWSAESVMKPRHRKFIDAIIQTEMHVIVTIRSKVETAQIRDDSNRVKVVQLGMKSIQQPEIDFEFDIVLDINHENNLATPIKDRSMYFKADLPVKLNEQCGKDLHELFNSGVDIKKKRESELLAIVSDLVSQMDNCNDSIELDTIRAKVVEIGRKLSDEHLKSLTEAKERALTRISA